MFLRVYRSCTTTLALLCALTLLINANVNATFSIVAVDTATGAIGSAGASCIANSFIISDIIEGVGAAHTQALWLQENKDSLHQRMLEGLTPDSALAWMVANDASLSPGDRQYVMVTLAGPGASAGYTGADNTNFKGDLSGPTYALAGNILISLDVLADMEAAYLATEGQPLEDRLMAALQAAKRPGADHRCSGNAKSAISAFIKVVHPGDGGNFYLFENVPSTAGSVDPIDVLQNKFDDWKLAKQADPFLSQLAITRDTLPASGVATADLTITPRNFNDAPPTDGVSGVSVSVAGEGAASAASDNGDGTYTATLTAPVNRGAATISVEIDAGGVVVEVAQQVDVFYYLCGDADNSGSVNIADVTYLLGFIFSGGAPPQPNGAGDADWSGGVNIADATYLIARIFSSGPAPICPD
ncbi:MAG TPA: DUF1028 domain-containing protein [candidate division Zixibacteria bacterium]|nr:DUF1028 domain-containing protein [candidate division Zixibacteria bacterium]